MTLVDGRGQMRDLVGQAAAPPVNLQADFEQAERFAVLGVFEHVAPDAGQQRGAHQRLVGGDGIGHAHVRRGVEAERPHGFLAQERVVVDLGEALVDEDVADFVLELARRGWRAARATGTSGACGAMES